MEFGSRLGVIWNGRTYTSFCLFVLKFYIACSLSTFVKKLHNMLFLTLVCWTKMTRYKYCGVQA